MNKTPLLTLAALLVTPVMAENINRTLDAAADGLVMISNTAGSVDVTGWSRNSVEVTGTLGDDVEELIFERDGDEILIKVKAPSSSGWWGSKDIASKLKINVPKNSSLEVATISADINIEGVHGEQELQAISGNIDAETYGGDIEIESVSGDVEVEGDGSDGDFRVESVSGDVTVRRLAGDISAGSVSGEVTVVEGSFDRADIETVNGEIIFAAALRNSGRLEVETVNGDVRIDFIGDVSARVDIETFNGGVDNCFGPKAEQASRHGPGLELSFVEGAGNGRVSIETLNGDVHLCKK